jgi:hypothetical protein
MARVKLKLPPRHVTELFNNFVIYVVEQVPPDERISVGQEFGYRKKIVRGCKAWFGFAWKADQAAQPMDLVKLKLPPPHVTELFNNFVI